jgi:hypothetical protein
MKRRGDRKRWRLPEDGVALQTVVTPLVWMETWCWGRGSIASASRGKKPGQIGRKEGLNVDRKKKGYFFLQSLRNMWARPVTGWALCNPILGTRSFKSTCVTTPMWEAHLRGTLQIQHYIGCSLTWYTVFVIFLWRLPESCGGRNQKFNTAKTKFHNLTRCWTNSFHLPSLKPVTIRSIIIIIIINGEPG